MASIPAYHHEKTVPLSDFPQGSLIEQGTPGSPGNSFSISSQRSVENREQTSSSSEDEVVATTRPKRGLAARLISQAETDESEPEQEVDGKTAYQLLRQRLLGKRPEGQERRDTDAGGNSVDEMQRSTSSSNATPAHSSTSRGLSAARIHSPSSRSPATPQNMRPKPQTDLSISSESSPDRTSRRSKSLDKDVSEVDKALIRSRVLELVAKKRAERLGTEEEHRKKTKETLEEHVSPLPKSGKSKGHAARIMDIAETDSDEQASSGRKLTQEARPTRKASKKALQEMNRETQRISRNQQLAHSVQTKTKYRKEDLFAKFGFRTSNVATLGDSGAKVLSSAPASSDMELDKETETPPSSPPIASESKINAINLSDTIAEQEMDNSYLIQEDNEVDLPPVEEVISQSRPKADKGKAPIRGHIEIEGSAGLQPRQPEHQIPAFRVITPTASKPLLGQLSDSEDDIEIVGKRFAVFDRIPAQDRTEPHAMRTLRAFAHLKSPGKTRAKGKGSMTANELKALLVKRQRDQARKDRDERLDELRAKGVYIPTKEETQKEQLFVENLLEKAREEAQELSKKEKDAAKTNGGEVGDGLPSSDEEYEDEDSEASGQEVEENAIELSGSEDENQEEAEDADDEDNVAEGNGFLADEAEDSDGHESVQDVAEESIGPQRDVHEEASEDEASVVPFSVRGRARNNRIIDDDDEETEVRDVSHPKDVYSQAPDLGLGSGPAPLSMTQMFAATMDAEQSQSQDSGAVEVEQDSIAFLRQLPPPTIPDFDAAVAQSTQTSIVPNSQAETPRKLKQENLTKRPTPATARTAKYAATEYSDVPDPTQDFGFELSRSPGKGKAMLHSTIETVTMSQTPQAKTWGRVRRKAEIDGQFSDVDEQGTKDQGANDNNDFETSANAFDVMRTAAKKPQVVAFDKKRSEAKDMVEEQAQESEDEYAGLGGASDDESGGEDEEVKKMMDESDVKLNERGLAALFAEKERERNEKEVERLFRDVANGGLRRKRGADFDLSDSDDDVEARRRRRQREHARHMKALLQNDENLGKIAEQPKKAAFLRAIEDHDSEDEMDLFDDPEQNGPVPDSQVSTDTPRGGPSETQVPASNEGPLKRKHPNDDNFVRPPAQLRRTNKGKKPSNLAEVRETLSFLIDDQQSVPETPISGSESEQTISEDEEAPRTSGHAKDDLVEIARPPVKVPKPRPLESHRSSGNLIIDRLSLKRFSGSTLSESENSAGLAFHATSKIDAPGFKMPSLLRRATTIPSTIDPNSNSAKSRASATVEEVARGGVRRGGTKKSSINYAAREAERKSTIEEAERKRKDGMRKVAGMRRGVLGGLGGAGGGFE